MPSKMVVAYPKHTHETDLGRQIINFVFKIKQQLRYGITLRFVYINTRLLNGSSFCKNLLLRFSVLFLGPTENSNLVRYFMFH
jgi:hypothetical protein